MHYQRQQIENVLEKEEEILHKCRDSLCIKTKTSALKVLEEEALLWSYYRVISFDSTLGTLFTVLCFCRAAGIIFYT